MKKVLLLLAAMLPFGVTVSCTPPNVSVSAPISGVTGNAPLAVKDYETRGIIFVKSQEKVDNRGNVTGTRITYEMLLKEAQKKEADDVINVRVDVTRTLEYSGFALLNTVYDYTGTALAIKYTNAKDVPPHQQFGSMAADLPAATANNKGGSSGLKIVGGILGGLLLLIIIGVAADG